MPTANEITPGRENMIIPLESLQKATQDNPVSNMNFVGLLKNIEHLKAYRTMNKAILEDNPINLN